MFRSGPSAGWTDHCRVVREHHLGVSVGVQFGVDRRSGLYFGFVSEGRVLQVSAVDVVLAVRLLVSAVGGVMDRGDFPLSTLSKPEHSGLVIVTWGAFRDPGVCVPTR